MNEPPFIRTFRVEIQFSKVAFLSALNQWKMVSKDQPTVVWVDETSYDRAWEVLNLIFETKQHHFVVAVDSGYQLDWWSLGTHQFKGIGSTG